MLGDGIEGWLCPRRCPMRERTEGNKSSLKTRRAAVHMDSRIARLPLYADEMSLPTNDVARRAMLSVDPSLADQFSIVGAFLMDNPSLVPRIPRHAEPFGSEAAFRHIGQRFADGRRPRRPSEPSTIPDPVVSLVMREYFGLGDEFLAQIAREHSLSMGAEGIVGDLLERYIASVLDDQDWIWCSGESVRSVDFLRATQANDGSYVWESLQIKNRDNSENSSSSAIRNGTDIKKWFRSKSRTGDTMWSKFPVVGASNRLSESGFQAFVVSYLRALRNIDLVN